MAWVKKKRVGGGRKEVGREGRREGKERGRQGGTKEEKEGKSFILCFVFNFI
jgi:hypothetical protein